jgi:hypothetical protein
MSGPKVVRVRTREERQAETQAWIRRAEAAARRWESKVGAAGLATPAEIAATAARASELSRLLESDEFDAIERQARQEIAFLDQDLERRRLAEADRRAQRRKRTRRVVSAAATVLASLREAGKSLPPQIASSLEQAASGRSGDAVAIEAAIAEALEVLAERADADLASGNQAALAAQLQTVTASHTLADWLTEQPGTDEPFTSALDSELSRLEIEAGEALAAPFAARARSVAAETSDGRRRLLYDSLRVDLAAALRDWRSRESVRDTLAVLAAELAAIKGHSEAAALQRSIVDTLTQGNLETAEMTALRERAAAWLSDHRAAAAAQARREAVLGGLAAVGYEVREGMAGLWSEGGRLVLRRGGSQDIAVELLGNPAAGRVQLRAVGFADASGHWDHGRDLDIEHRFCHDLHQVQGRLKQHGVEIVIDRATPAGTQPLRTITADHAADEQRRASGDQHVRRHR